MSKQRGFCLNPQEKCSSITERLSFPGAQEVTSVPKPSCRCEQCAADKLYQEKALSLGLTYFVLIHWTLKKAVAFNYSFLKAFINHLLSLCSFGGDVTWHIKWAQSFHNQAHLRWREALSDRKGLTHLGTWWYGSSWGFWYFRNINTSALICPITWSIWGTE